MLNFDLNSYLKEKKNNIEHKLTEIYHNLRHNIDYFLYDP